MWDPTRYLHFADHRSRPFHELLARIDVAAPQRVVDLGCGPGTLTAILTSRWPDAVVEACDSSPEMVQAAIEAGIDARVQAYPSQTTGSDGYTWTWFPFRRIFFVAVVG